MVHTIPCKQGILGCSAFARHYLRNHYCFIFLRLLRCFNSPGIASTRYFIHTQITGHYTCWVFPFGNLRLITGICPSPKLIAAYHVLHRLLKPRHPPYTLSSLIKNQVTVSWNLRRDPGLSNIYKVYMRLLQLFNTMQLSKNTPHNAEKWFTKIYTRTALNGGRDRSRTCDLILIRDAL